MCEAIENLITYERQESEKKGKELGLKEGSEETTIKSIQSLTVNLSISVKEAMKLLDIPDKEQRKYMKLVG